MTMPSVDIVMASFAGRHNFGQLLTSRELTVGSLPATGEAVEIGTHRGAFAAKLLGSWPGYLHCIDPYINDYSQRDPIAAESPEDRHNDFLLALKALMTFSGRFHFTVRNSSVACATFRDQSVDFVYIDGNHENPHPKQDIQLWWPKIKPGGILAGHDYDCPSEPDFPWRHTVKPAVEEFAINHGLTIYLVLENDGSPWSWYLDKPTLVS